MSGACCRRDDLTNATEIIITPRNTVRPHAPGLRVPSGLGSSSYVLKDARFGCFPGATVKAHRRLLLVLDSQVAWLNARH